MGDLWFYGSLVPTDWAATVFSEVRGLRWICHDLHLQHSHAVQMSGERAARWTRPGASSRREKTLERRRRVSEDAHAGRVLLMLGEGPEIALVRA